MPIARLAISGPSLSIAFPSSHYVYRRVMSVCLFSPAPNLSVSESFFMSQLLRISEKKIAMEFCTLFQKKLCVSEWLLDFPYVQRFCHRLWNAIFRASFFRVQSWTGMHLRICVSNKLPDIATQRSIIEHWLRWSPTPVDSAVIGAFFNFSSPFFSAQYSLLYWEQQFSVLVGFTIQMTLSAG